MIAPGRTSFGGVVRMDRDKAYGALRALDATTGERKWEFRFTQPTMAGVMSTASGLVFAGDNEGNFMAFDSRTGQEPVALLDRHTGLGRRADDLHARRQAARRHCLGHDAAVVCVALQASLR